MIRRTDSAFYGECIQGEPEVATAYLDGDLRHPGHIVQQAAETLDFGRPVGLMLVAELHFIDDSEDPYGIVRSLVDAMPDGSYLVISHLANDVQPELMAEAQKRLDARPVREPFALRNRDQVARFFDGLDLVDPGAVLADQWRPDTTTPTASAGWRPPIHCGIARSIPDPNRPEAQPSHGAR